MLLGVFVYLSFNKDCNNFSSLFQQQKVCNNVGSNAEEIANVMAKVVCSICTNQNGAFADTAHNRRACLGTCRK